jgi:Na+:H+ antiporter, NhaA family
VLASVLVIRTGLAERPRDFTMRQVLGAGALAGIGFTMSLFIAGLALEGTLLDAAKIGTLVGSTISGTAGLALLVIFLPRPEPALADCDRSAAH